MTLKKLWAGQNTADNEWQTHYTVPSGKIAIIKEIHLHNPSGTFHKVAIRAGDGGVEVYHLADPGDNVGGVRIKRFMVLEEGESIDVYTTINEPAYPSIYIHISGAENGGGIKNLWKGQNTADGVWQTKYTVPAGKSAVIRRIITHNDEDTLHRALYRVTGYDRILRLSLDEIETFRDDLFVVLNEGDTIDLYTEINVPAFSRLWSRIVGAEFSV